MAYQVLARKWRPKSFASMVGQEHVLQTLCNALDQNRLHHAYLFTGTRGVGKTTIARILAKCLNCEKGVSSEPCSSCDACLAIDTGRFVDLIEVDAASRTKVEDTRELLENVQYAPAYGRYKVYLIDEVHMLSGHSFNALLKTLEEPPPHVKFLLATTDPQKLPVTVLSRCLQFNLKNLLPERISKYLAYVLTEEEVKFESPALDQLAQAADGSMRDALSLLDQAIAFGNGVINTDQVHSMLGTIEQGHIIHILKALQQHNASALLTMCNLLAEQNTDYQQALEALLSHLHQLAVIQALPNQRQTHADTSSATLQQLATQLTKADIQLFYQIALLGRRDMPLAPSGKAGFEMVLLRMLDFRPVATQQKPQLAPTEPTPKQTEPKDSKKAPPAPKTPTEVHTSDTTPINWNAVVKKLPLKGMTLSLAQHSQFTEMVEDRMELLLSAQHAPLLNQAQQLRLQNALSEHFNRAIKLNIRVTKEDNVIQTPALATEQQNALLKQKAQQSIETDTAVASLLESFDATVDNASIQAVTQED